MPDLFFRFILPHYFFCCFHVAVLERNPLVAVHKHFPPQLQETKILKEINKLRLHLVRVMKISSSYLPLLKPIPPNKIMKT